jgi:hypothetical protein
MDRSCKFHFSLPPVYPSNLCMHISFSAIIYLAISIYSLLLDKNLVSHDHHVLNMWNIMSNMRTHFKSYHQLFRLNYSCFSLLALVPYSSLLGITTCSANA